MTKQDFAILMIALTALAFCSSCVVKECTEEPCSSHLRATFDKDSAWENGDWKITMLVDGSAIGSCEFAIQGGTVARDEGCTAGLYLGEGSNGLGIDSIMAIRDFDDGKPSEFTVRVEWEGAQRAEQTLEADYQTVRPNGPGCPPECQQAEAELAF
jgi:hypothetical protein